MCTDADADCLQKCRADADTIAISNVQFILLQVIKSL